MYADDGLRFNGKGSGEDFFLGRIDPKKIPAHVAIIMDGNGRWAKKRALPRLAGHKAGVKAVRQALEAAHDLGIKYLTLYAFSLENWRRPEDEVSGLMRLLVETVHGQLDELNVQGIRLNALGRWREMAPELVKEIERAVSETAGNTGGTLNLAVNYGARAEIVDAAKSLALSLKDGSLAAESVTEEDFASRLYTAGTPDPELLIRTSGELRVSNFLLWQIAYAEIWISPVLWPDFKKQDLYEAIYEFQQRKRRFGGLNEED